MTHFLPLFGRVNIRGFFVGYVECKLMEVSAGEGGAISQGVCFLYSPYRVT